MQRGRALRRVVIRRKHRFGALVATLIGPKNLTRHGITIKGAMYNSRPVYAAGIKRFFVESRYMRSFTDWDIAETPPLGESAKSAGTQRKRDEKCRKPNSYKDMGPVGLNVRRRAPFKDIRGHGTPGAEVGEGGY